MVIAKLQHIVLTRVEIGAYSCNGVMLPVEKSHRIASRPTPKWKSMSSCYLQTSRSIKKKKVGLAKHAVLFRVYMLQACSFFDRFLDFAEFALRPITRIKFANA